MKSKDLEGWKEIATHLEVSVRTAQKKEQNDGLPIYRAGKGPKSRVHAYQEQLDDWLASQGSESPSDSSEIAKPVSNWRGLAGGVGFAVLLSLVLVHALHPVGPPVRCEVDGEMLRTVDKSGRLCWKFPIPGAWQSKESRHLIEDIDFDGELEVLFDFQPDLEKVRSGKLFAFTDAGDVEWVFDYRTHKDYKGRWFDDSYAGYGLYVVETGGRKYVLAITGHQPFFPTRVVLLEPTSGGVVSEYWHPGRINKVLFHDIDDDGNVEVLLGGPNNPNQGFGHAGVAVLEIPFKCRDGNLPDLFPVDFTGGCESAYFLFPRPDVTDVTASMPHIRELLIDSLNQIQVTVGFTEGNSQMTYYLSTELELLDARPADGLKTHHNSLYRAGHLDHTLTDEEIKLWKHAVKLPTAPDGNHLIIPKLFKEGLH